MEQVCRSACRGDCSRSYGDGEDRRGRNCKRAQPENCEERGEHCNERKDEAPRRFVGKGVHHGRELRRGASPNGRRPGRLRKAERAGDLLALLFVKPADVRGNRFGRRLEKRRNNPLGLHKLG